ncbi:flavin-containing monooxygenase [Prauserella oleivorans]
MTYECRFLINSLGLLSAINIPEFPGIDRFAGRVVHTAAWPEDLDVSGKRVGVIGNGSTGNQVITATAPIVAHLTSFQRTPQYSVPAGNRELSPEVLQAYRDNFEANWEQVRNSTVAMGFVESEVATFSVSAEERERIYQRAWDEGGGFRFMFETFNDVATDAAANEEAAAFIRRKIREIVSDPETARKLTPHGLYARRPLCDSGYYETFNRPNVSLERIDENPITHLTEKGVVTADGRLHELDVLILATGFDAVEGNYRRIDIRGLGGQRLADHWADGPSGYLGMVTSGFPNMFMVLGPQGPFVNNPPMIEAEVDWIADLIGHVMNGDARWIDVRQESESAWLETCSEVAHQTLFPKVSSWIFGGNAPGGKETVLFFLGGLKDFREALAREADQGYPSFRSDVAALSSV